MSGQTGAVVQRHAEDELCARYLQDLKAVPYSPWSRTYLTKRSNKVCIQSACTTEGITDIERTAFLVRLVGD